MRIGKASVRASRHRPRLQLDACVGLNAGRPSGVNTAKSPALARLHNSRDADGQEAAGLIDDERDQVGENR